MVEPTTYVVGGTVQAGGGVYVERAADRELLDLCRQGAFAYVLTSRQLGKSSLMMRAAERLIDEGARPVIIDLTHLGADTTPDQWYRGLLLAIHDQLELATNAASWWETHADLAIAHRFILFLEKVVLVEVSGRVVIFVDEIDTTLRLSFTDDFFAGIRYLYNARAAAPDLIRLSFVLIGVATPGDLIKDAERTPFNIGHRVELTDFTNAEAAPLARGLGLGDAGIEGLLRWVLEWTGGHPYLTLRVFRSLQTDPLPDLTASAVERRVVELFFGEQSQQDSNLRFVRDMLTTKAREQGAGLPDRVLALYRDIRRGRQVLDVELDHARSWLKLSGLVSRRERGLLRVRNRIYESVFTLGWVRRHARVNWPVVFARVGAGLVLTIMLVTVPLAWVAWRNWRAAESSAARARASEQEAHLLRLRAEASEKLARQNAAEAERQRAAAETHSMKALQDKAGAERLKDISMARGLAAQAALMPMRDGSLIERSVLLAGESLRRFPTVEGMQAILGPLPLLRKLVARVAHGKSVGVVVFSPDGQLVVSGSDDHTVRVFETGTGRERVRLSHGGPVKSLVLSADGRTLVTGSEDRTARIWDVLTGKEVARLVHAGPVWSVALSPDRRLVVTGSDDSARLWDAGSGRQVASPLATASLRGPVWSLAFSPDGQRLVTGSEDGTARVWSPVSGAELAVLTHGDAVGVVAFSPDGRLVVSGAADGGARVWDAETGSELLRLLAHNAPIWTVAFSPDGRRAVTGSEDRTARVWDIGSGKEVARITHEAQVRAVAFSPDGETIATGSEDKTARLCDANTGAEQARLSHDGSVWSVAFSPDGRRLVTGSADAAARVWHVSGDKHTVRLRHEGPVLAMALNSIAQRVATGGEDRTVRLWELETGRVVGRFRQDDAVQSIAFSPNGRLVMTGSTDGTARLWDTAMMKEVGRLQHEGSVRSVTMSPDGRFGLTGSADRTARLFAIAQPSASRRIEIGASVSSVAFSPDSRRIVTGDAASRARVFAVATGQQLAQLLHRDEVLSVAFGPDGLVASGSADKTVRIWKSDTGTEITRLTHGGRVSSLAFSLDGRWIATGSDDKAVRLWNTRDGVELAQLKVGEPIRAVEFSRDGRSVAVASGDHVAFKLWRTEDLIRYACDVRSRPLSREEWKESLGEEPFHELCER